MNLNSPKSKLARKVWLIPSEVVTIEPKQAIPKIGAKLDGLRWGEVRVIIRDGRVTQIDRVEQERFTNQEGKK